MDLTHDELITRAVQWLEYDRRCKLVLVEAKGEIEKVDALGFNVSTTILVEAKASRSDFLRDKEKLSRSEKQSEYGYGQFRYYICESGTITIPDLPNKWGLIYATLYSVKMVRGASSFEYNYEMLWRERCLLVSEFGWYQTKGLSKSRKVKW